MEWKWKVTKRPLEYTVYTENDTFIWSIYVVAKQHLVYENTPKAKRTKWQTCTVDCWLKQCLFQFSFVVRSFSLSPSLSLSFTIYLSVSKHMWVVMDYSFLFEFRCFAILSLCNTELFCLYQHIYCFFFKLVIRKWNCKFLVHSSGCWKSVTSLRKPNN